MTNYYSFPSGDCYNDIPTETAGYTNQNNDYLMRDVRQLVYANNITEFNGWSFQEAFFEGIKTYISTLCNTDTAYPFGGE
jgi:hypothetical protein